MSEPRHVQARVFVTRKGVRLWLVPCPYCGEEHLHAPRPGPSESHCAARYPAESYEIEAPLRELCDAKGQP